MRYYSTKVNKLFDTVEECEKAEKAYEEKQKEIDKVKAERAEAAKRVEEAYKKADKAIKAADEELKEFCKKYGAYHKTVTGPVGSTTYSLIDFLNHWPVFF